MTTMDDTQSRPLDLTQGQGDVVQAYEPGDAKIQIIGRGEQGWRTIESAPKDGRKMLGLIGEDEVGTIWWHRDAYEGEWWMDEADSEPEPTHWMPLPSAPGSVPTSLAGQESDEVRRLRYLLGRAKDALSFYASAGKYLRNYHNSYPDAEYDPHMNYGLSVHHKMHHVETAAKVFDEIEAALSAAPPQPTAGGDAPIIARGSFPDDEPECCPRCGNAWERPDPFALANGIDRAIKKAVSAERARVIALETALRGAIANLEHVSVFDEADDDDQEAIEARSAWQRDLDRFRAALLKASPGGTKDAG
jgi:hypothetical protein